MPAKDVLEAPQLDEGALRMLEDHSCCGPAATTAVAAVDVTEEREATAEVSELATAEIEHGCCAPSTRTATGVAEEAGDTVALPSASGVTQQPRVTGARRATGAQRFSYRTRVAGFLAIAALILGTALWLVRPMNMGEAMADYTIDMSMSGFNPPSLDFPAGKTITVKLVNNESPFHASGAEHQFAVDALGINEKLQAKQTRVITIPAQKPGQYTFYCDVCCGGQKSPTMRGTLTFH